MELKLMPAGMSFVYLEQNGILAAGIKSFEKGSYH